MILHRTWYAVKENISWLSKIIIATPFELINPEEQAEPRMAYSTIPTSTDVKIEALALH